MMAIEKLKALNYTFSVQRDASIKYKFHGLPPTPKEAMALLAEVISNKVAAIAYLRIVWPPESMEAERKFGVGPPRLYPFINQTISTPLGYGKLCQVGDEIARVSLLKQPKHMVSLPWIDVWPIA